MSGDNADDIIGGIGAIGRKTTGCGSAGINQVLSRGSRTEVYGRFYARKKEMEGEKERDRIDDERKEDERDGEGEE